MRQRVRMSEIEDYAAFARSLAAAAGGEALAWLERGFEPIDKNEQGAFDPVTEADRAAERAMRERIEAAYPDHGIWGEEYGEKPASGPWSWSLDPIDGTRAFVCGMPGWTVLIALLREGEPVLGVIDVPRMDERYVGFGGEGILLERGDRSSKLRVSGRERLEKARLSTTDPYLFAGAEADGFERVRQKVQLTRYGFDAYAYARLAAGWIDLVIETGLKPHDYNALIPVVRAAGGVITNWRGEDEFSEGKVVAAASRALLDEALELLNA